MCYEFIPFILLIFCHFWLINCIRINGIFELFQIRFLFEKGILFFESQFTSIMGNSTLISK